MYSECHPYKKVSRLYSIIKYFESLSTGTWWIFVKDANLLCLPAQMQKKKRLWAVWRVKWDLTQAYNT